MAGEPTIRLTRSVQFGSITVGGVTETISAGFVPVFSQEFGVVTDAEIDMTVDISTVLVAAISADKDCTLKTNSSGSPVDTFLLKANQPLIYRKTVDANFFTVDVTKFFLTTSVITTLKIGIGADATP